MEDHQADPVAPERRFRPAGEGHFDRGRGDPEHQHAFVRRAGARRPWTFRCAGCRVVNVDPEADAVVVLQLRDIPDRRRKGAPFVVPHHRLDGTEDGAATVADVCQFVPDQLRRPDSHCELADLRIKALFERRALVGNRGGGHLGGQCCGVLGRHGRLLSGGW
ncbi:hypothetical protein D9M72_440210 [compost metagenome]